MCGRYSLAATADEINSYLPAPMDPVYRGPSYNVAPTQASLVITPDGAERMKFGLVPVWAKSPGDGAKYINARAETVFEKSMFKRAILDSRCLVLATGYYEWKKTDSGKQPYYYSLSDRSLFCFAGIYYSRKDAEGNDFKTFAIVTCEPNALAAHVHDRMPVILSRDSEKLWLDPDMTEPDRIEDFLAPYPADKMNAHRVSLDVGNVRNNRPDLVAPINSA